MPKTFHIISSLAVLILATYVNFSVAVDNEVLEAIEAQNANL